MYRRCDGHLQVLLVHPGGPFWKNKDVGAWSIPKGEYVDGEEPLDALALKGIPREPLEAFLMDQGFRSLLTKLGGEEASAALPARVEDALPFVHKDYETVVTEAEVWHWHGAAPDQFMTHLAVYEGAPEWGDLVSDGEYLAAAED